MSEIRLSRTERLLAKLAECLKQQQTELNFYAGEIRSEDHLAQSLLAQCVQLEKLDVDLKTNHIDLATLARFKRLRVLWLRDAPLGDWSFLGELPDLQHLQFRFDYAAEAEQRDYTFLQNCKRLEDLCLIFCGLQNVDFLAEMPLLRKLNLRCNSLETLNLPHLPALQDIDIGHNELTNIDGLLPCADLRRINADDNKLVTLPDLTRIQQLEYFDFSENRLNDISQIGLLPELKIAYLNCNSLANIDALARQPKLEKVFFGRNPIQDPPPPAFIRMATAAKARSLADFDNTPPPDLDKIWPLIISPDPANRELGQILAEHLNWSPDDLATYLAFALECQV